VLSQIKVKNDLSYLLFVTLNQGLNQLPGSTISRDLFVWWLPASRGLQAEQVAVWSIEGSRADRSAGHGGVRLPCIAWE